MDAYASIGMPVGYHHWSYGKQFLAVEQAYRRGQMGLAYENAGDLQRALASFEEVSFLDEQYRGVMQKIAELQATR